MIRNEKIVMSIIESIDINLIEIKQHIVVVFAILFPHHTEETVSLLKMFVYFCWFGSLEVFAKPTKLDATFLKKKCLICFMLKLMQASSMPALGIIS